MTKYHINKHGVAAPCKARPGNCPLGGMESHFDSMGEAQSHANKVNESSHGILPGIDTKDDRNILIENWINNNPEEVKAFIETGVVSGFEDDFSNDNVFANGISESLENNFESDIYPEKRKYINEKTKDLVRLLRGDIRDGEENFIDKDSSDSVNKRANNYYDTVMSKDRIVKSVIDNVYDSDELVSDNVDDYEVHAIPITSDHKELLGNLNFLMVRKDDQAVLKNPIVDSQGIFINTYNNEPIDGSKYSESYAHYNSADVSRLTADMKQWRRDALNTEDYPDDQQIIDKYGPALGRDVLPVKQIRDRVSNPQ